MNEYHRIEFPVKFRCSSKFVNELEQCEAGLFEDVCRDRENDDDSAQEPVVGDFIDRHKTIIEVEDRFELSALKWALESGTTSINMPTAVFRLLDKINLVMRGKPHEAPRKRRPRVVERQLIEGHDIEKHVIGIAKLMERSIDDIVPLRCVKGRKVRTVRSLSAVPFTVWRRAYQYSSGRANSSHVHLTLGTQLSDALHVIIHELCHALIGGGHGHSKTFKTTERSAHRLFNNSSYRERHNLPVATMRGNQ